MKKYFLYLATLLFFLTAAPIVAQDEEPATPVGVVSLVWGEVTVKHSDADYKPARRIGYLATACHCCWDS